MKLLIVSNMWPLPEKPNFGIFVKSFCEELASRDFPFDVIHPEKEYSPSFFKYLVLWQKLAARKEVFDLLQVEFAFPTDLATRDGNRSKYRSKILVFHGSDIKLWRRLPAGKSIYQRMLDSAAAVVFPSRQAAGEIEESFKLDSAKSFVIPRGIDPVFLGPSNREAVRKVLGVSDSEVVILSVANFVPVKNHLTIIKALKSLKPPVKTAVFFVGDGPTRAEVEREAEKISVSNLRVLFTGAVPKEEVIRYYDAADIFVTASLSEGYNVSLREAMARGLAIVASDIPAHREALVENKTGLFFSPLDSSYLAELLSVLIADERLRRELGNAAQKSDSIWTMKRTVDEYLKLYNLFS